MAEAKAIVTSGPTPMNNTVLPPGACAAVSAELGEGIKINYTFTPNLTTKPSVLEIFQSEVCIGSPLHSVKKDETRSSSLVSLQRTVNAKQFSSQVCPEGSACSLPQSSTGSQTDVTKKEIPLHKRYFKHFKKDGVSDLSTCPIDQKCFDMKHSTNGEIYNYVQASIRSSSPTVMNELCPEIASGSLLKTQAGNAAILKETIEHSDEVKKRKDRDDQDDKKEERNSTDNIPETGSNDDIDAKRIKDDLFRRSTFLSLMKSCISLQRCLSKISVDAQGQYFFIWMAIVSFAFVYNAVVIPLRVSFDVQSGGWQYAWFACDYLLADPIYLIDLIFIQPHLHYRKSLNIKELIKNTELKKASPVKSAVNILKMTWKLLDVWALLPLDLLYVVPSLRFNALLRLPRLLKFRSLFVFQDRFESSTKYPNSFRASKIVFYFSFINHIWTCIYHAVSESEGLGVNEWVYNGQGNSYLRCFYWALLTISNARNLDEGSPVTNLEYVVELCGYITGLFVLAIIIGEVRDCCVNKNVSKKMPADPHASEVPYNVTVPPPGN